MRDYRPPSDFVNTQEEIGDIDFSLMGGVRGLLTAIVWRAFIDLRSADKSERLNAIAFFRSTTDYNQNAFTFKHICQELGLDRVSILREVKRAIPEFERIAFMKPTRKTLLRFRLY